MKDDRATFMKLSDSAMDENFGEREGNGRPGDRAISMRTSESAKVMTRVTGISL